MQSSPKSTKMENRKESLDPGPSSSSHATLKSSLPPPYLSESILSKYLDLYLISSDGCFVAVNKLAFAAFSKYSSSVLSSPDNDNDNNNNNIPDVEFISTDIASKELRVVGSFVMSGCVPMMFEKKALEAFKNLGISLAGLKFLKVDQTKFKINGKN